MAIEFAAPIREDVVNDLRHFWRLDYQLSKRAIGCAIICMATKLHFLDNRGNFIIEHAVGFTKAGGAVSVREVEMVPEYFKSMSRSLLEVLKTCSTELEIKDGIMYEIYQLWKENYDGLSRETGCVLHCMSQKLDLFNVQGKFEHGNTKEFIMKHGAVLIEQSGRRRDASSMTIYFRICLNILDSSTATQLEEMVHICQHKVGEMADECLRVLEMAKCIRGNLTQINWNPNMEVAVEEIVAEA
ncbi:unnamed protein product [Chilo suppressalis]|uniref:Uncharacterized protein n=1 Tax=Chilo suppressalis TaxID=168631 RepID=A0ABN8AZF9_CHISP|nr:unnamed protein product [Chilo suppressalis]